MHCLDNMLLYRNMARAAGRVSHVQVAGLAAASIAIPAVLSVTAVNLSLITCLALHLL